MSSLLKFNSLCVGQRTQSGLSSQSWFSNFSSSALRVKTLNGLPPSGSSSSNEGLIRRLGLFDLILLELVLESLLLLVLLLETLDLALGVLISDPSIASQNAGAAISFIFAGGACVLNSLCYAELASRLPAVNSSPFSRRLFQVGLEMEGLKFFSGVVSINLLAPILLVLLTIILCRGVGESSAVNSFMTATKVVIVLIVIFAGAFEVDVSNWTPFAPNGFKGISSGLKYSGLNNIRLDKMYL
ncbi:hypothetical protein MKW92_022800 [Papaver armeniacum]|nr:hypothetical protein MKW92_022800 [Papaver armeniacum]